MMTLAELRTEATKHNPIEIQWDMLESDVTHAQEFMNACELVKRSIGSLENIYQKLTTGKSVTVEGEDSPLRFEDVQNYTDACADELFAAYQILDVYDRYMAINNVMKT